MKRLWEMTVLGAPRSFQGNRQRVQAWKRTVNLRAKSYWDTDKDPFSSEVSVSLVYFYEEDILDVDNIIKPILDGIIGVSIVDDSLVSQVLARKTQLQAGLVIENVTSALAEGLEERKDFVYLSVNEAPNHVRIP